MKAEAEINEKRYMLWLRQIRIFHRLSLERGLRSTKENAS